MKSTSLSPKADATNGLVSPAESRALGEGFPLIFNVAKILELSPARSGQSDFDWHRGSEPSRKGSSERGSAQHCFTAATHSDIAQNDVVTVAGKAGTWKVVAPVNGTKADLRKREGFDTRIVTTSVEKLTIIRRAGSPGSDF
jgi:hypothetical protein